MFFVDFGFTELLPKTRTKAIHPKFMETPFLANHVCLEGFEDMTKAKGKIRIYPTCAINRGSHSSRIII